MTALVHLRRRLRARSHDRINTNWIVSELVALALIVRAHLASGPRRLASLLTACRRATTSPLRRHIASQLRPHLEGEAASVWREQKIGWRRYDESFGGLKKKALTTSLLLKAPGPNGEKGVLYSSFEYNWMRLVAHHDARAFFARYYLVGASSWSPTDYAAFANLAGLSPDPVFIGISNVADVEGYKVMRPVIEALPLMACDWINPAFYEPKPHASREIDILMVANWLPFKRHWLLFEALKRMRRDLRVVLIGRNAPGRTVKELGEEARSFGVRQEIEFLTNVSIDDVTAHQCNARISTLFSRREGSCVAPAECFFADTPVAMMRDGHVGSKAHINPRTGILVERAGLARRLEHFLEESASYAPREWALQHITCHQSSARLNEQLRAHALGAGQPWTGDITALCWRYVPSYVDPADEARMAPAVEQLRAEHGVELVKFAGERG